MTAFEILKTNLLSPIVLAFLLGIVTKLMKSELSLPKDLYSSLSIYLLLAIGLKGGVELSESTFQTIAWPAFATLALGCITPISAYLLMRKLGRFGQIDAAALAAHYGSVSAVTFIAANQFIQQVGETAEGHAVRGDRGKGQGGKSRMPVLYGEGLSVGWQRCSARPKGKSQMVCGGGDE